MWIHLLIASTLVLVSSSQRGAPDAIRNESRNPHTESLLGEKNEWIWVRPRDGEEWRRLIPGRCPQWSLDGKRFYYFLDVGYDGNRAELWSASADGEGRIRLTQSDYFIADGPVAISPDERSLAFVYRTSRASGDFQDIVVVDLRPSPVKPTEGRVVLRTRAPIDALSLKWSAAGRLSVVVDGVRRDVDATSIGVPQKP